MRKFTYLSILSGFVFMVSCSIFNPYSKLRSEADEAYQKGRLNESMELYEQIIEAQEEKNRKIDTSLYISAGKVAYELEQTNKTIEYLEIARINSKVLDEESLIALIKTYHEIDNLSLEIRRMEDYIDNYPNGKYFVEIKKRYFLALAESKSWEQAYEFWPKLEGDPLEDESLTEAYFSVNNSLENNEKTAELAKRLLELNKTNKAALEWHAKKYYYRATERYKRETQAYEKNRTNKQYAKLLDAWGVIHDDFRKAKDYFELLYKNYPESEYANFLANIYERLNNDSKARYYRQRAND